VVAQVGGDKAALSKIPPAKENKVTAVVFKPSRYLASADRDSAPMGSSARELWVEIDSEDSEENGDKDQPGRVCFTNMMIGEEFKEDTSKFSYDGLLVPLNILFDQDDGFTLQPREG
jgi:hypothetical protein